MSSKLTCLYSQPYSYLLSKCTPCLQATSQGPSGATALESHCFAVLKTTWPTKVQVRAWTQLLQDWESHDFTRACKSECYSPQEPKRSCASENKTVSGWFQVLGGGHGVLEMGSLLFTPTVSTQKENGHFSQLLEKSVAKVFLVWGTQPKFDVQFLVPVCFPTVKYLCFLEKEFVSITACLAQRPKHYRYCHYHFVVRWQRWAEKSTLNKFVRKLLLSQTIHRTLVSDITVSNKSGFSGLWASADGLGAMVCQN